MKQTVVCAVVLASVFLAAGCAPPAASPNQPNPAVPSSTPVPTRSPENAIYGNELPRELQDFTFFGEPTSNYTVTMVTPRRFERFVSFDSTLSAPEPYREESAYESEHVEYPSECQGGSVYRLVRELDFAVAVEGPNCAGAGSGTTIPGILRNNLFTPLTGYEEYIDTSKDWDVVTVTAEEHTVVWYLTPIDESADAVWFLFSTDLQTLTTSYLGNNSDPIFEQSSDPAYVFPPYSGTIADGRFVFTLFTMPQDTDLRWAYMGTSGGYAEAGDAITEALVSIRLDGTDARKELDPILFFDPYNNPQKPLIVAAGKDTYALLQRTGTGAFTEICSFGWNTEHRPYPTEIAYWSEYDNGRIVLLTGKYIVVAQEADRTLTIVDSGINVSNGITGYHHEPLVLGDHLVWAYYHWDNEVTGIYALNRTNYRGVMTLVNDIPGSSALENGSLRIQFPTDEDQNGNPLYRQGYIPLP